MEQSADWNFSYDLEAEKGSLVKLKVVYKTEYEIPPAEHTFSLENNEGELEFKLTKDYHY